MILYRVIRNVSLYARANIPLETVAVFQINVSFTTRSLTHSRPSSRRLARLKGAFAQFANPPSSASFVVKRFQLVDIHITTVRTLNNKVRTSYTPRFVCNTILQVTFRLNAAPQTKRVHALSIEVQLR